MSQPPQDPLRPQWPQQPGSKGPRKHWSGRRIAAVAVIAGAALFATFLVIVGAIAGSGSGSTAGAPLAASSSSALAAPPSTAASQAPCTTHACIVADAKSSLIGDVAKDESVLTALTCYSSTVRNPDPGVWTVHCLATYSDGTQWDGIASVLISKGRVTWEATQEA